MLKKPSLIIGVFIFFLALFIIIKKPIAKITAPKGVSASFTLAQIASHGTKADCWMAIEGNIYDVTQYIDEHPSTKIIEGCGKDASVMYRKIRKHTAEVDKMLPDFLIGKLRN